MPVCAACAVGGAPCPACGGGGGGVLRRQVTAGGDGNSGREMVAPPSVHRVLSEPGEPLPAGIRRKFEKRLGVDLGGVRVHSGHNSEAATRSLQARAFAVGSHISFSGSAPQADNAAGELLQAHEVAHVALGHPGLRRLTDEDLYARAAAHEADEQARAEARQRHTAWSTAVDQHGRTTLPDQSATLAEEREQLGLALTAQQAAAFEAAGNGEGWLRDALREQGYNGPGLPEIRQSWAEALVTAELLRASTQAGEPATEARLAALMGVGRFYDQAQQFAQAVEAAHATYVRDVNARQDAAYARASADYAERERMDQITARAARGDLGGGGFAAGLAIARGAPPARPTPAVAPAAISGALATAATRLNAAERASEWDGVAQDVSRLANGLATLVVASLPTNARARQGVEYLEGLDARLASLERSHEVVQRIPAVFYPKDQMVETGGESGVREAVPESIPWQFYLVNTGVPTRDQPARSGGEWVLIDLTSNRRFENRAPASDLDSARLQQGEAVDPPRPMFAALNSAMRFPEGRLLVRLPSGAVHELTTTAPISLSDFLSRLGIVLAAIALTAAVVATGGAATPAAVAFYAGLGATAAGVGATLAEMHERSEHGMLTSADVDRAMVLVGIDLVSALSMGLGRIVGAPGAAARLGSRFVVISRVTQVVRAGALTGDLYQALTVTQGFVDAFRALERQPGLTDPERERMRAQLVRRALLSGAIMTVAIRGDVADLRSGGALHVARVDPDGALVVQGRPHPDEVAPDLPAGRPGTGGGPHAAPHAEITAPVHADAQRAGSGLEIGSQPHALAAQGTGPTRDFYFCSDRCTPLVARLEPMLAVLPRNHPEREIFQGLLSRARGARQRLRAGRLSQEQADDIARQLKDDIRRHSAQSELFAALMNTDPRLLDTHRQQIRGRLARDLDVRVATLESQGQRQAVNRGDNRGRDPLAERTSRSPLETDLLGGFSMQDVAQASRGPQPLHFDVGNFSHTHAEALVPGLPRGLAAETPVTLPDGSVGRADRVRFTYDANGDRIGAFVYEIKPNRPDQVARGERQAQDYVEGLRLQIEADLRAKGREVPTRAPDGGPLYGSQVLTYDQDRMMAVLRALRGSRRDAAQMAELEAIARSVFQGN